MSQRWLIALSAVFVLVVSEPTGASAAGSLQEGVNVFLGSPFLILGIIAGLVAVGFAFYSASQMKGGRMAGILLLLGTAVLLLDLGVLAVTLFAVDATTKLIHDLGLLSGFVISLIAFGQMRRIVG